MTAMALTRNELMDDETAVDGTPGSSSSCPASWYATCDPKGPLCSGDVIDVGENNHRATVLMEWIEQGMDFFGCDENTPNRVFGDTLGRLSPHHQHQHGPQPACQHPCEEFDYATLHDEFLESLLIEQSQQEQ